MTWLCVCNPDTMLCVALQPAEQSVLTALKFAELVVEAGFPPGVVHILPGYGPEAGMPLVKHTDVGKVWHLCIRLVCTPVSTLVDALTEC